MTIFVIAEDGTKLMPTSNVKKVRRFLRSGRAVICKHEPFTIKLCYKSTKHTQPIEFKQDAGYQHIGISICSQKHEYVSEERVLLKDEVERHNDSRKYRRTRRNRKRYRAPRFNNRVVYSDIKKEFLTLSINVTYGTKTKRTRNDLNIIKSHANDAYCMGEYRPLHRAKTIIYQKRRRNNRILEKFYDAKYIDIRDNSIKSGQELSCGRTNRSESRNSIKNERIFRGTQKSKGHCSIRRRRYELRPGDLVLYNNNKYRVIGVQNHGDYTKLEGVSKVVRTSLLLPIRHVGGWEKAS